MITRTCVCRTSVVGQALVMGVGLLLHPGRLNAQPTGLMVEASAGEMFDSNVTFRKRDPHADAITLLGVGLMWRHETKTGQIDLEGRLRQQLFARHSEFNNLAEEAKAQWRIDLSRRDHLRVSDAFLHAEEPRSFEDELARTDQPAGRSLGRYGYYRNRVQAEYERELTGQTAWRTTYANDLYALSVGGLRDSFLHEAGTELSYAPSSSMKWLGAYEVALRAFQPGGEILINRLAAGFLRALTTRLSLEGRGGAGISHDADGETAVRPFGSVSLRHEAGQGRVAALTVKQDYTTTPFAESLFKTWRVSFDLRQPLLKRLAGECSSFIGEGEYLSLDRRALLGGVETGLAYELAPNAACRVSYRFSDVHANDGGADERGYLKHQVFVGVTMVF